MMIDVLFSYCDVFDMLIKDEYPTWHFELIKYRHSHIEACVVPVSTGQNEAKQKTFLISTRVHVTIATS